MKWFHKTASWPTKISWYKWARLY